MKIYTNLNCWTDPTAFLDSTNLKQLSADKNESLKTEVT